MSLLNYWPTADEINRCINHEAEGVHDAVLLAVHQPSSLSYRLISSDRKIEASEEDLFKYLITNDVPSGAHVVPITGASGVGKSHMVRILAAHLENINDSGRFVIIRIPKSASIRRVVELILEKLPGDEYAVVREGFAKAVENINLETAVISFQSQLDISLIELAKELQTQIRLDPGNSELKERCGHAKNLPKFMGDPVLVDYFREKVFPRIVKRAVSGQDPFKYEESVEDFRESDFEIPDGIDITKGAESTQSYYLRSLQIRGGEGRRSLVRLLNESKVIDQSIRQVFKLHEALGGMTLQEVILEIRRLLFAQNRELVILVEDFKALTGIQDTLLNVLIQEGVRDGLRELATMRSVIAVTDGYIRGQDTIATRAKREWIVESHLSSDEEVLRRTKALVASYLNAARWGYGELNKHFQKLGKVWSETQRWIDAYTDDDDEKDAQILSAFGHVNGIPLFPFTDLAIERLARSALTLNNTLVFTPRFIINDVIRDVLLVGRPAFEQERFPPPGINAPRVNAQVTNWLAELPFSAETRDRYGRLVAIWGNLPQTPDEIGFIPQEVFDAFGLERPNVERQTIPVRPVIERISQTSPPVVPVSRSDDGFMQALENWVQKNETLKQVVANQIRKSIETALNDRIDWQSERCAKFPITAKQISIPNAAGEAGISINSIRVAEDNADPTGQLRFELAAVNRYYNLNGGDKNYAEVDDDLVWIGNLTERLMPQALDLVRADVGKRLAIALHLLAMNSRILGIVERGRTAASLTPFLFGTAAFPQSLPEVVPSEFSEWRKLQELALRVRTDLIQQVLVLCGSFQGSGKTAYAIDIVRIVECMPPDSPTVDLSLLDQLSTEVRQHLPQMSEARVRVVARKALMGANNIRSMLVSELNDEFNKQEIVDEFKALAEQYSESGAWNTEEIGMGLTAFRSLCEEFRVSALREAMVPLGDIGGSVETEEGKTDKHTINRMGRFDVGPLLVATRFVETARKVINVSEKRAKGLEDQYRGLDPQGEIERIQEFLTGMLNEINHFGIEG
jgi:hypothetical protein